jgi:hypothetical protein
VDGVHPTAAAQPLKTVTRDWCPVARRPCPILRRPLSRYHRISTSWLTSGGILKAAGLGDGSFARKIIDKLSLVAATRCKF